MLQHRESSVVAAAVKHLRFIWSTNGTLALPQVVTITINIINICASRISFYLCLSKSTFLFQQVFEPFCFPARRGGFLVFLASTETQGFIKKALLLGVLGAR